MSCCFLSLFRSLTDLVKQKTTKAVNYPKSPAGPRDDSGVWAGTVAKTRPGSLYRFENINRHSGTKLIKSAPYARGFEHRPGSAAYVVAASKHRRKDDKWLAQRGNWDWQHAPANIYEVHAGAWLRHPDGKPYPWGELAAKLIPYVVAQGYTHLELLPITEHPLDESWGYQTTGYFAPSSRYGSPDDLRAFIDACHQAGLGVLLDWVPGHFPQDDCALARFDGTALYEHEDPRLGLHVDWGTHIFNYGRHEVRSFLMSSAHWWLSEFPGALTIAEESTAWPLVSRPLSHDEVVHGKGSLLGKKLMFMGSEFGQQHAALNGSTATTPNTRYWPGYAGDAMAASASSSSQPTSRHSHKSAIASACL